MNYYEHHLGDYMRDTAHLSVVEDGIYRRLLDQYYIRERPLPLDPADCCKLARAASKPERTAVEYILREYFEQRDDGYHQPRADTEIARFKDRQRKASASANARWQKSERNANASDETMRTHCEGNAPRARPQTPDTRQEQDQELTPPRSLRSLHPPADAGGFDDRGTSDPRPRGLDATTPPPPAPAVAAAGEAPAEPAAAASPKQRAKPKPKPKPEPMPALPEWIPRKPWAQWAEVRERMRAPLTAGAVDLAIRELTKLRASGHDPATVIEQSVLRGWRGLFPIHGDHDHEQTRSSGSGRRESLCDRVERLNREADARDDAREQRAGNVIDHPARQRVAP